MSIANNHCLAPCRAFDDYMDEVIGVYRGIASLSPPVSMVGDDVTGPRFGVSGITITSPSVVFAWSYRVKACCSGMTFKEYH